MKIQKVIKCRIVSLTKIKEQQISKEYSNLQEFLQLECQGLFKCRSCGYELNADVNGVRNILSLGYMPKDRALSQAPNSALSREVNGD